MSAQPTKMDKEPTWQSLKGTLIHRCALAAAGKWLTIREAARLDTLSKPPEPHLVAEARWMAQQLGPALRRRDKHVAWSLIDSGGPRWIGNYNDYLSLDTSEQPLAIVKLEDLAVTTASAILDMAHDDQWEDIQSEVSDPFARLTAYTAEAKKAANWRIDLLAHRGDRPPAVVDLKIGDDPADPGYVNALAVQVASKYGREVATIIDSRVTCRVLYVAFDGSHMWSDATTARPRRAS
jgi:hypothetical protein